jgi:arabinose-5-phosphate isomerase
MEVAIIPTHLNSKRLKDKPLRMIAGKPILKWVWEAVSGYYPNTYIATDSLELHQIAKGWGASVLITDECANGTERCAKAAKQLIGFDYVINVQGDMPFIGKEHFSQLRFAFGDVSTLWAWATDNDKSFLLHEWNLVTKFTRTRTPYKHIGIYKYRYDVLQKIAKLPATKEEQKHSLEQLRWLNQYHTTAIASPDTLSVDTEEDLQLAQLHGLKAVNCKAINGVDNFCPKALQGQRIITSGMGKAGQIAQLAASLFASNGITSHFLHPADAQHGDLGRVEPTDALLLFSNSGETRELIELCQLTKNKKYLITSKPDSTLGKLCQTFSIGNPAEACTLGLTPSTSLMAMLLAIQHILFSLSTITRKEYGNLHHGGYLGQKAR